MQSADINGWNGDANHMGWRRLVAAVETVVRRKGGAPRPPAQGPMPPPPAFQPPPVFQQVPQQPPPYQPPPQGYHPQQQPAYAYAEPRPQRRQGGIPGIVWALVGGLAVLGMLAVAASYLDPALHAEGPAVSAEISQLVSRVDAVVIEAANAVATAQRNATQGQADAARAINNEGEGYGTSVMPQGTVSGNLAAFTQGQVVPIGIEMANGAQFYGTIQNTSDGYTMSGRMSQEGTTAIGFWTYRNDGTYSFVGDGDISGKLSITGQERGATNASTAGGEGKITYFDGTSYKGEFESTGISPSLNIERDGVGILYDASGTVLQAGRWTQDAFQGQ
jgi:hypothetical protein